ncbi:MAG TPA: hypothetical protein DDZ90_24930 [Planctomycetaceae bacterium]|nr:hypothetical protein [Gimesia sp.]HBL46635.1 hypothetical protein [Planctomycetaceae bacterium]
MNPLKTKIQWSQFFKQFNNSRRNYEYNHKVKICFLAKMHITKSNSASQRDDIHYDFIAFTDVNLSSRQLSRLINTWIIKAGGRPKCECKVIHDRSRDNISRICDYVMKATGDPHFLPLPELARLKLITKTLGDFWGRSKQDIEQTRYFNGELETNKRPLSGRKQVWHLWCKSVFGNDVPKYETSDFITQKKVIKTLTNQLTRAIRVIVSCSAYSIDVKSILNTAHTTTCGIFFTPLKTTGKQENLALKYYSYIGDIDEQIDRHLRPSPDLQKLYYVGFRGRLLGATDKPLIINGKQLNRLLDVFNCRVVKHRAFQAI